MVVVNIGSVLLEAYVLCYVGARLRDLCVPIYQPIVGACGDTLDPRKSVGKMYL